MRNHDFLRFFEKNPIFNGGNGRGRHTKNFWAIFKNKFGQNVLEAQIKNPASCLILNRGFICVTATKRIMEKTRYGCSNAFLEGFEHKIAILRNFELQIAENMQLGSIY